MEPDAADRKGVFPITKTGSRALAPVQASTEVTESDRKLFEQVVSDRISPEEQTLIEIPPATYPRQPVVLAVHWHPEWIPMDSIRRRVEALYPHRERELIIPTQHNEIMSFDGTYSGLELDCFAEEFNQKVQLLIHFQNEALPRAGALAAMAAYTFKYRSSQFFDFLETIVAPREDRLERAARESGADETLIGFCRSGAAKIKALLLEPGRTVPASMIKNKLLRDFFDGLRPLYGQALINRAQAFLNAVKKEVKQAFPLQYFYRAPEVIEEARSLGAGIVIPHPEQFWPILLADYDVDGVEVWNPQSRKYTEFLISLIAEKNQRGLSSRRRLLILMGDDTHMSEKLKADDAQDPAKAGREVGHQPAWDELSVRKKLIMAKTDAADAVEEYRGRLG